MRTIYLKIPIVILLWGVVGIFFYAITNSIEMGSVYSANIGIDILPDSYYTSSLTLVDRLRILHESPIGMIPMYGLMAFSLIVSLGLMGNCKKAYRR